MPIEENSSSSGVDLSNLGATRQQLSHKVEKTPDAIINRYRENKNWKIHQKEWIYKNLLKPGMEVLDFGCGTGEISTQVAMLGAKKVYSVDVTPGLLDVTARRAELDGVGDRVETICDFIQNVPPRQCDLVIAFAVLHHCHPISGIMPELLKWLKPGGTFVCVEPLVYFDSLEKIRVASGVPFEPLDEGEHKLSAEDVEYVCNSLDNPQRVHFRLVGRADRWLPDLAVARVDWMLFKLPLMWKLAGSVLIHGKKRG